MPTLDCFPLVEHAPVIVPGRSPRPWMNETTDRFAYRCLPLTIANTSGWEILCPAPVTATWNGGDGKDAVTVRCEGRDLASSHFGHGILTFHTGYLFRTSPGWALWARGAPNMAKRNLVPLDGLVETDWLAFPFTMNWRFTRAGSVSFETGEPFCFITLAPHALLDEVQPRMRSLEDEPELREAYKARSESRSEFNAALRRRDEEAVKAGWQRDYFRGERLTGEAEGGHHVSKRRLKGPKWSAAPKEEA